MAGLKKMLCLFMAAVLLAAVPFSVFAATNRPAQQLGQNKTKWCWAAALGMPLIGIAAGIR